MSVYLGSEGLRGSADELHLVAAELFDVAPYVRLGAFRLGVGLLAEGCAPRVEATVLSGMTADLAAGVEYAGRAAAASRC